jgi:hypothetical protein
MVAGPNVLEIAIIRHGIDGVGDGGVIEAILLAVGEKALRQVIGIVLFSCGEDQVIIGHGITLGIRDAEDDHTKTVVDKIPGTDGDPDIVDDLHLFLRLRLVGRGGKVRAYFRIVIGVSDPDALHDGGHRVLVGGVRGGVGSDAADDTL